MNIKELYVFSGCLYRLQQSINNIIVLLKENNEDIQRNYRV